MYSHHLSVPYYSIKQVAVSKPMLHLQNSKILIYATAFVIIMLVYGFKAGSWSPTATQTREARTVLLNLDQGCFAADSDCSKARSISTRPNLSLLSVEGALQHLRDLSGSRRTSWQAYFAVVIGALGFIAARPAGLTARWVTIGISISFCIFAVSNLGSLSKIQTESIRVAEYLCSGIYCQGEDTKLLHNIVRSMRPYSPYQVWAFHLVFDWITLVLFWNIPVRQDRESSR